MAPSTSFPKPTSLVVASFAVVALMVVTAVFASPSQAATHPDGALAASAGIDPEVDPEAGGEPTDVEVEVDVDADTDESETDDGGGAIDGDPDDGTGAGAEVEPTGVNDDSSIVQNPLADADADDDAERGSSDADDRKLWVVIGGLLLVALALTVLTVRYWRQTRPVGPQPVSGRSAARSGRASGGGRRSRSADDPAPYADLESDDLFVDES